MSNEEIEDVLNELTEDQKKAAKHIGSHARLLAGPGTGKTRVITKRVLALILLHKVAPEDILILTFTRLAARQLHEEVSKILKPLNIGNPHICTLHSFALQQLLHI